MASQIERPSNEIEKTSNFWATALFATVNFLLNTVSDASYPLSRRVTKVCSDVGFLGLRVFRALGGYCTIPNSNAAQEPSVSHSGGQTFECVGMTMGGGFVYQI